MALLRVCTLVALVTTGCAPDLCNVVETEHEHRVVADLAFLTDHGARVPVAFDVNRTIDPGEDEPMAFEGYGDTNGSFSYTGEPSSKALSIHFRSSVLARLDDAELNVPELPGVGTFPLTNALLCRCNDPSPFPGVSGCVETSPYYRDQYADSPRCEEVSGVLEVRELAFSCDDTFTVPTCTGDLDVRIRIESTSRNHLSGTLHIVERSRREKIYGYCGGVYG